MSWPQEAAPAKINLALHVTGRRADGYHLIESLTVFAALGDTVAFAGMAGAGPQLTIDGTFAAALGGMAPHENLVLAAAAAFGEAAGKAVGGRFHLTKRIPVAAGLGGGSTDAAATLRLLERTRPPGLGGARLAAIAERLGADVPMCLAARPLIARGTGEAIAPVAGLPALPVVLVHSGVPVPTPAVFAARSGPFSAPLPPLPARFTDPADVAAWLGATRNDLAGPAVTVAPDAGAAARALGDADGCLLARMSGSGGAAFGIFATAGAAEEAAARMREAHPAWFATATMTGAC